MNTQETKSGYDTRKQSNYDIYLMTVMHCPAKLTLFLTVLIFLPLSSMEYFNCVSFSCSQGINGPPGPRGGSGPAGINVSIYCNLRSEEAFFCCWVTWTDMLYFTKCGVESQPGQLLHCNIHSFIHSWFKHSN